MKALVKQKARRGIWAMEVPKPAPSFGEVLVAVEKTAICGTDLHIYKWDAWSERNIQTGRVLGHEFVGEIVELGEGVSHYKLGDRVSAEGHVVCGRCRQCREGRQHHCPHTLGIGLHRDGAFAEFVAVPEQNLWAVPEAIPSEVAAFLDPLGNAAHCAFKFDLVGEDVLIAGAGPIGILAAGLCKYAGAHRVVITDVNPYRLKLAEALGATLAVNVAERSLSDALKPLGLSDACTVGLEMSGHEKGLDDLVQNLAHGAKVALLGILPNEAKANWDAIIFKSLELHGIYGRQMYQTWYKMTAALQAGFPAQKVLTHQLPAAAFQEGFDLMEAGSCGKVVLDWSGGL